jgi:hypothetical protein
MMLCVFFLQNAMNIQATQDPSPRAVRQSECESINQRASSSRASRELHDVLEWEEVHRVQVITLGRDIFSLAFASRPSLFFHSPQQRDLISRGGVLVLTINNSKETPHPEINVFEEVKSIFN